MKWGIYLLSATITCFVVLFLAVIFMLLKYRKKLKETSYSPVDKQSIKYESCLGGAKKPYIERLAQYLLGYSDAEVESGIDGTYDDDGGIEATGLTKLVAVQPSSESDGEYHTSPHVVRPRTQSYQNNNTAAPQIDAAMYRNRAYTDSPSPEGRGGIWRARESLFYKHGKNRRSSYDDSDADGRRSPLFVSEFPERSQFPRRSPIVDRRSKILYDETTKVTGKPPPSPKTVKTHPSTPSRQPWQQHFNFNTRRNSAAMVLDDKSQLTLIGRSGSSSINGSVENLATELGNLEVSLFYSSEERLLKVCVVNIRSPEERSLVDTFIKVTFYLFEKPYKNEMRLWSDSTKSLVRRTFSYLVKNISDLQRAVLKFTLKRKNGLVRNKSLGKSILRLCNVNLVEAQAYTLKLHHSITELVGEILVSVCHQATTGILRVGVIRAMGLARTMRKTMGAPFLIIELRNQDEVVFVKNTKQKSNKINPLFEETFDIPVSTDSKIPLDEFHLQITVFRYTFSGSNDVVGLICLETGSSQQNEADHWKEVTLNPHTTVMKWHKLRIA